MFHYAQHFSTFSGRIIMSHIWFCQYYFRYKNEQVEFSKHTKTWISIWMWENWNLKCYCCDHNDEAFTLKRFRRWSTKTDSHNLFTQSLVSLEWELVHLNTKVSFIVMTKSVRKHTTGELIIVKIPIFQWCYCYCRFFAQNEKRFNMINRFGIINDWNMRSQTKEKRFLWLPQRKSLFIRINVKDVRCFFYKIYQNLSNLLDITGTPTQIFLIFRKKIRSEALWLCVFGILLVHYPRLYLFTSREIFMNWNV